MVGSAAASELLGVVSMAKARVPELPPDNGARIVLYDGMCELTASPRAKHRVISPDRLFEQVVGRLRVLVPHEVHLAGERPYFDEKLKACIEADLARRSADGVTLGDQVPSIRYPDGEVRSYAAGLQAARLRLERDDAALRRAGFDVRNLVPSLAGSRRSPGFQALVDSMREHGYLKQLPILRGADGEVVDGRARIAAAAVAGVQPVEVPEKDRLPNRLDTPLHRVLLVLALNAGRITEEDRDRVLEAVADKAGRSWTEIESDLLLTRDWRRAAPKHYEAYFEVEEVPFRPGEPEPTVQVTTGDRVRVGMRKLVEAAGMSNYKLQEELRGHVIEERARTQLTTRPAIFVEISNAIEGIDKMQADRRQRKLKLDPKWDVVKQWLVDQRRLRAARANADEMSQERLLPVEQTA
jgi:hypothetical protein